MTEQVENPEYARIVEGLDLIAESEGRTILREVVKLHCPVPETAPYGDVFWRCEGCDPGEHAYGPADAPCATLRAVAGSLGIEL